MISQILLFSILILSYSCDDREDDHDSIVSINNVSVVDVKHGIVINDQTILIKSDVITFVGDDSDAPDLEADFVLDGTGKYAIPGLWDMHIHGYGIKDMQLFPINGVVGVRLMWGMPMHRFWRKQFESGQQLGPRMMIASAIIDGPQPIWPGSVVAKDKPSGIKAVKNAIDSKSDFAKVYSLLPRKAFFAIAEECNRQGYPFDGHVPRMVTPIEASNAGQRCMEHLYELQLACSDKEQALRGALEQFVSENDGEIRSLFSGAAPQIMRRAIESFDEEKAKSMFEIFKKNNTWHCPTLTVLRNMAYLTEPEIQNNSNLKYLSKGMRNMIAPKKSRYPQSKDNVQLERERFQMNLKLLKMMHKCGVPILAGTDVLNPFCLPGFSLHTELELMVKAGFTPAEALQTATINPAKFQKREQEMGTINADKIADIVLLNANPLKDIGNTRTINAVVYGGKVFDRQALDALLGDLVDKNR